MGKGEIRGKDEYGGNEVKQERRARGGDKICISLEKERE